jgi:hypothetical protein
MQCNAMQCNDNHCSVKRKRSLSVGCVCALVVCVVRLSAAVDLFFEHAERYECNEVPNAEDLALDSSADPETAQATAEAVRARAAALSGEAGVPTIYFVVTIIGSLLLALVRWIRRPPLKPHIN